MDELLNYYERELTFIREMGAEFANKYPKIAGRLLLEPDKCEDPHTERLIEAFAFLCARIHKKIDDDFPEITESLLNIIYPHYVSIIPSMSIAKFEPLRKTVLPSGTRIEKNTELFSKPVGGIPCQFVTAYPITLLPVEVTSIELREPKKLMRNAQQAIVIQLKTFNKLSFSEINLEKLRFYLNGPKQNIYHLYELLFNNVCHIECESKNNQGKTEVIPLAPDNILPVGFNPDEEMIPYSKRSFPGYLLLFEYFCFPEKFLFFDLNGLDTIRTRNLNDTLDIWIYLNRIAKSDLFIDKDTFCINTAPIVNLFKRIAEPISIEHKKIEYPVIPDIRRPVATEVFSIDKVSSTLTDSPGKEKEFRPFYSISHYLEDELDTQKAFWHVHRRPSDKKDDKGTNIFLSFTDLSLKHTSPDVKTFIIYITCTNRDLPSRLPFGDPGGDFQLETAAPVERIQCLIKPTQTGRPSFGGTLQWRLISHLALNYMSIVEGGEESLKEMLKLYDFDNSPANRQQINGIVSLQSKHITKRIGQSMCRGIQTTIEFDEDKFVGTGLYLFASVLERFLGEYVSINSFSRFIAKTIQKKEILKQWPPRNGNQILL